MHLARRLAPDRSRVGEDRPGGNGRPCAVDAKPKSASPWGLLDMAGNMYDWTADWYSASYYKSSPSANPKGPSGGVERVIKGGSWRAAASADYRASRRPKEPPSYTASTIGFRCAKSN